MTWDEWNQALDEIKDQWPVAAQGDGYLSTDYAGEYARLDTLRAWYKLVKDFTLTQVLSAIFRYATTDEENQWPPQGPTIARLARDIAAEDQAREARERAALPPPADENPVDGLTWAKRNGFGSIWDAVKARCVKVGHHGDQTTETCRLCNGLPPISAVMAKAANG